MDPTVAFGELAALLALPTPALVAAIGDDGLFVPMPDSVPLGHHQVIGGRSAVELVARSDRFVLIETWQRARAAGTSRCVVALVGGGPQVEVRFVDARAIHGVHLGFVIGDLAATERDELMALPVRPLVARVQKDMLARFVAIDRHFTTLLGWEDHEVVGRAALDFIHPDDQEEAIDSWMTLLSIPGSHARTRLRHRAADGSFLWMEVQNRNGLDDAGQGLIEADMVDVSEEMAAQLALKDREEKLFQLAAVLPIGIAQLDRQGEVLYANHRLSELLGLLQLDKVDTALDLVLPEDRPLVERALETVLSGSDVLEIEVRIRSSAGAAIRYLTASLLPVFDSAGAPDGLIACVSDATESARMRVELERRALFDDLTGCHNRASTMAVLEEALAVPDSMTAVIYADLDGFKAVNDALGHAVGDELLMVAARRLRNAVRPEDTVGRMGGDEFLIVCPGVPDIDAAPAVAERVAERLAQPIIIDGAPVSAQASLGVALATEPDVTADSLVAQADAAMYQSKRQRAGRPVVAVEPLRPHGVHLAPAAPSLRRALALDELAVHCQPVVDLVSGRVVAFEALLRWQRGDELVPAREFIELAEATGLIVDFGDWMFGELSRQVATIPPATAAALRWSINVSAAELREPGLSERMGAAMATHGLLPRSLVLEASEDGRLLDDPVVRANVADLTDLGVQLALDSFGTGRSSLALLRTLAVCWLRIHGAVTAEVDGDDQSADLVGALATTARALGLTAVAEGIETDAQRRRLLELGVTLGQGHLFAGAAPLAEFFSGDRPGWTRQGEELRWDGPPASI